MIEEHDMSEAQPTTSSATWRELASYLLGGFGLFLVLGVGVGSLFRQLSIWVTLTSFALNILCLAGAFYVLGVWQGPLSWEGLGLWPIRWRWSWLLIAGGVVVILLPVRSGLALLVQSLLGGIEGLQPRMDLLVPGNTFSWLNLLVMLIGGGILVPVSEELYFRGLLHSWFMRHGRLNLWWRAAASALIFGLAHFDSAGVIVASFILGWVNALLYEKTRSLWVPIAVHVLNNSLAFAFMYTALALESLLL